MERRCRFVVKLAPRHPLICFPFVRKCNLKAHLTRRIAQASTMHTRHRGRVHTEGSRQRFEALSKGREPQGME